MIDETFNNVDGVLTVARTLLAKIEEVYAEAERPLPERRYLHAGGRGDTVHEREQVTVSWEQAYTGQPGAQSLVPQMLRGPRSGVFVTEVVRDTPGLNSKGGPPSVEALNAVAEMQMRDAQLLMEAGMRAAATTWNEKGIVDVAAGAPSGLRQAMIMNLVVVI